MIELLKKYKVITIFIVLVIFNVSWYIIKENQAKSVSIKLNQETASPLAVKELSQEDDIADKELSSVLAEEDVLVKSTNEQSVLVPKIQVPVYICGEIMHPGVYYIDSQSIINDIIELGGGFTSDADINYLNLASQVMPNQKIYIPKIGEEIDKYTNSYDNIGAPITQQATVGELSDRGISSSKININTATEKELQTLTGIGEVKARAIVEYRINIGRFKSVDELTNVSGIGAKTLEKVRAFITV